MPVTLPLTTRRAWIVTLVVLSVFLPLVAIDTIAADAEDVPTDPQPAAAAAPAAADDGGAAADSPATSEQSVTTEAPATTAPPTTAPPTTAPPTTAPPTSAPPTSVGNATVWGWIANCETGGNWSLQVRSFGGGLMIHQDTWEAMGGTRYAPVPSQASKQAQITIAEKILAHNGDYSAWPACRRKLGLP